MGTPIAHRTIPFSIVFPSLRYLHDNAELGHSFPVLCPYSHAD